MSRYRKDLDDSSGYSEMSLEISSDSLLVPSPRYLQVPRRLDFQENSTPRPKASSPSPPYKRVRALQLFDSPLTPKTLVQKSMQPCSTPRTRLFSHDKPRAVASAYARNEKPSANVNPFTPNGLLMNKKRHRSAISAASSPKTPNCSMYFEDISDIEIEQPTKRVALQESNISRYHQEFHEVELVGTGQFGSVYKCINRLDGCTYAIKKSKRPVAGSALEKNALNEVYAHAVLGSHQHVVQYFSAWAEDNHLVIQNEYCNGGSLADRISQEALSAVELRWLLQHCAEGLRYIHSKGLVHLDLKPGNVFISKEKRIHPTNYDSADDGFEDHLDEQSQYEADVTYKIGDLGHVTSVTNPEVEEGDCRYMPTEILQEDYTHLTKADIFSLGLTVIEAAGSGPLPKNGDEWHKIRSGHLPNLPQDLQCDLVDVLTLMIHPDPALRPTAIQILQHKCLSPIGTKTKTELYRELHAERIKNEILSKKLHEAAKCLKSITPEVKFHGITRLSSRLIGKHYNRSMSATNF